MADFNTGAEREPIISLIHNNARIHFVGICGAGMTPLALLSQKLGARVSGTDAAAAESDSMASLRAAGISVTCGHTAEPVRDADAVIYSLAVSQSCPELVLAREKSIPILSRAELLGALSSSYPTRVAVAGAHGKSTTTAMLHILLEAAGMDPTTVSGATLSGGEALKYGAGNCFLCEACEYRDSFLQLSPTLAVITNIEHEHVDYFPTEEDIYRSFLHFARESGAVILNTDCPLCLRLSREIGDRAITASTREDAHYRLERIEKTSHGSLLFVKMHGNVEKFELLVPGRANALDALVAIAAADTLGLTVSQIRGGLYAFRGIARRLEHICDIDGRAVFYDYAHHPTEIRESITTLKELYGRVTVIFRPHTFSRTAALFDDFVGALRMADHNVLLDIYPAREQPVPGVSSDLLAAAVGNGAVRLDFDKVLDHVFTHTDGAIVLMGAGDVSEIKRRILKLENEKIDRNITGNSDAPCDVVRGRYGK